MVSAYGYAFIFFGTFFEGELVVIASAFLARFGVINFWLAMLICYLGTVSGSNFWYVVGKYGGMELLHKHGKYFGINEARVQKAHDFFAKYGVRTIFLSRFVFGVRLTSSLIAGSSEMDEKKFLEANLSGAAVWLIIVGSLGYLFGKSLKTVELLVKRTETTLLILAVLAIIILIFRFRQRSKNKGKP